MPEQQETVGQRIRARREQLGMSQKDLAEALGMSRERHTTISEWERDVNEPRAWAALELAELFSVSPKWLMRGVGEPEPSTYVPYITTAESPLVSRVAAGEAREGIEGEIVPVAVPENLARRYQDLRLLKVAGDSMNERFPEGVLVAYSPSADVCDRDDVVARVNDGDYTVKQVHFGGDTIILHPRSSNPVHRDRSIDSKDPDAPRVRLYKIVWATYPEDMKL